MPLRNFFAILCQCFDQTAEIRKAYCSLCLNLSPGNATEQKLDITKF